MAYSMQNRSFFNPNGGSFAHGAIVAPNLPLQPTHTPQNFSATVPVQDGGYLAPVLNPRNNLQPVLGAAQAPAGVTAGSATHMTIQPPINPAGFTPVNTRNYGGY
jgi:hypothetical protein